MLGGRPAHRGWLRESRVRGNMLSKTLIPTDEELGKKDDDHKPGFRRRVSMWKANWNVPAGTFRWRRRRLVLALVLFGLIYLASTKLAVLSGFWTPSASWEGPYVPSVSYDEEPKGPPPGFKIPRTGSVPTRDYSGRIKFYRLASSLNAASYTGGYYPSNRNVLFAVSNLKSASSILPLACQMATWNRNFVHVAFMGWDDVPLPALLELHGVDNASCPAIWHDARPDYMEYSNEARAESSVIAALMHINNYLHPQVVFMDDSATENPFFVRGTRAKTTKLSIPLVEIPKDRWQSLSWITRLDASSLKNWHKPTIEVVLQLPSSSTGGVFRLLKSLTDADYSGFKPPQLTVEVAADADPSVEQHLKDLYWPLDGQSQVRIRRRITDPTTREGAAVRLLESFYPTSSVHSYILLLTPNSELSPLFHHYLMYLLLEYRYSAYGNADAANIMGISLERPSVLLNGTPELPALMVPDMHSSKSSEMPTKEESIPFLWQVPGTHAALLFPEKWTELHSFVRSRIAKGQQQGANLSAPPSVKTESLPSLADYMMELIRVRGYSLLYPATHSLRSLVKLHNELRHPREGQTIPPESVLLPYSRPLLATLPFQGDLPDVGNLPVLDMSGNKTDRESMMVRAAAYANEFRETIGGCKIPKGMHKKAIPGAADDLFCFGGADDDALVEDATTTFEGDYVVVSQTTSAVEIPTRLSNSASPVSGNAASLHGA